MKILGAFNDNQDILSKEAILNLLHPIGSVIATTSTTFDPNDDYSPQTWQKFAAGRVLVGMNSSDSSFNTIKKTGGAKTVALTTAQLPSHTHAASDDLAFVNVDESDATGQLSTMVFDGNAPKMFLNNTTAATGSGSAHNNLQPYITVVYWERTA